MRGGGVRAGHCRSPSVTAVALSGTCGSIDVTDVAGPCFDASLAAGSEVGRSTSEVTVGKHAVSGSSSHRPDRVHGNDRTVGWPGPARAPGGGVGWPADAAEDQAGDEPVPSAARRSRRRFSGQEPAA